MLGNLIGGLIIGWAIYSISKETIKEIKLYFKNKRNG